MREIPKRGGRPEIFFTKQQPPTSKVCRAAIAGRRQDEARTGMTGKDLWTVSDGGKSVAILPGEQFAVFKVDGSVEIAKGPRAQPLAKGDRYAKLTKLSATPKQYFKITKAEGAREARVEHLSGPFTM